MNGPSNIEQQKSPSMLVEAKKNDDEHLFLHMPEGGSKIFLPLPLFLPFPFPIIEDVEKIYHRKKVLVLTEHKPKKKKYKTPKYEDFHHYDLGKGYEDYKYDNKDDYEVSSSDAIPSVYDKHLLDLDDDYSIKELYKPKKKKKITVTGPMSEFDEDPTKHFPFEPDEGDDVDHVEFSTEDGHSKDINPTTIMDKIRKFLTQENIKLKVNIDYNKRKRKRERKEEPKQRTRSIGKMIDEQIKKLEDDEHDFH
nr:uncharacterized protein LOC124500529 [Dermatophagoides farinae]